MNDTKSYLTGPRAQTQQLAWAAALSPALRALSGRGKSATRARKAIRRKLRR